MTKLEKKLNDAIFEVERKKVRYDSHVLIIEAHRKQMSDQMQMNQRFMDELMKANKLVETLNTQLQDEIEKQNETER